MYCPAHFQEQRPEVLRALMADYPLATIVRQAAHGLEADHVPLMMETDAQGEIRLIGHVAKANPLWQNAGEVLVIFQGPASYISPVWYPSKAQTGKVVPTFNYAVVHVQASLHAIHDPDQLLSIVTALTQRHESTQPQPWQVSDAPADYTRDMLHHIVGIVLQIKSMQGKWKLSQNQTESNRQGVVAALSQSDADQHTAILGLMQGVK